ncbi:MAG: amidohydrolase family protein [Candidatus Heimdallarchaeota archaeon]|nr:MAG: amidohydrolase family protein [Candidatus Heimdallarchaeota archaeon]
MAEKSFQYQASIDFHTHLPLSPIVSFTPEIAKLPDINDFLKALNDAHVTEAVLLCGPKKEAMRDENENLARRVHSLQRRFKLMAWLNPKYDSAADLQDLVKENDFHGLKLHPVFDKYKLSDPIVKPLIEKAIKLEVPIMIHSGWGPEGSVQDIGKLAEEYPDGTFVCCHMKEEYGLNERFSHIEMAAHNTNVYLESSYIPHPRRLAEAVEILGAERILFGSDYPWGAQNIAWEKTKVTAAQISYDDKKKILAENAKELLKL